jgi:chitin synthase
MVKGAGNDLTTPEICLSMMKDLIIPQNEVEAHSYVAMPMDTNIITWPGSMQDSMTMMMTQRSRCGNPREANDSKPGNRDKRDSQIVLMVFLQKVMFDERMTTFEYELFNSIWRCHWH